VTGYEPYEYIHIPIDAHIYENQVWAVEEMIKRKAQRLPTLTVKPEAREIKDLFAFRPEHFELTDYHPHPAIPGIPVAI
jgi:thymidylate synthase